MKRFVFSCLCLLAAASLGGVSADERSSIAFLRLSDGYWQLWLMNADGTGARALTRSPVDKVHVAWRPGAPELLYHTNRGETWLLDTASGRERRLLEGLAVTDAAWSPDGQRLAYSLPPEDLAKGKTALWTSNLDGSERRKLAGGGAHDALAPAWLADGRILYRQCLMTNNMEVLHDFWILDPDRPDAEKRLIGDAEPLKFDQVPSSTGVVAYSSPRSGAYEIWAFTPDGAAARQVTSVGTYAGNPTWSPDGKTIAFDSDKEGAFQVFTIGADGRGLARLTTGEPSRKPVWKPAAAARPAARLPVIATAKAPVSTAVRPATPASGGLSISWVSTDKVAFDPGKGEVVSVRFQVSQPTEVLVRFLDPADRAVRTVRHQAAKAGDQRVDWDGKDDAGQPVAPEAYTYVLSATAPGAAEPVVWDLRGRTGGDVVWPQAAAADAAKGLVTYTLPQASRVRLIMSRQDTTWPIRTLLDWAPRLAGSQEERWDGRDAAGVIKAWDTPQLIPIVYAFSLPRNVVLVQGAAKGAAAAPPASAPRFPAPAVPAGDRSIHLHARHDRDRCFDPAVKLIVAGASPGSDPVPVAGPTTFRLDVAEQAPGRPRPVPRVSVFVYVDGVLAERYLVGYVPFQWVFDPSKLTPGEHVVTALLSWRDDHFGIAHTRVRIATAPKAEATGEPATTAAASR